MQEGGSHGGVEFHHHANVPGINIQTSLGDHAIQVTMRYYNKLDETHRDFRDACRYADRISVISALYIAPKSSCRSVCKENT